MKKLLTHTAVMLFAAVFFALPGRAQECRRDSVKIWFHQSKINLDPDLHGNREALRDATARLDSIFSDPIRYKLGSVRFVGAASPEGSIRFNRWLSEQRAATLIGYLNNYVHIPDSLVSVYCLGRDWEGLKQRVLADQDVPDRDVVLSILENKIEPLEELKKTRSYYYLYTRHFPELRASSLVLEYTVYEPLAPVALSGEAKCLSNTNLRPYTPPSGLNRMKGICGLT
ncbi:MAG: hypothetical protein PUC96_02145 [Bacteroidales bacterium]|nr:hypothetical protein [Bacteroidales bacterium]